MSPYQQARNLFMVKWQFDDIERAHLAFGFLFATPLFFACGRPINSQAPQAEILDYYRLFDPDECDAWFIQLVAGDMQAALAVLPWELPLICFSRDFRNGKGLRFYRRDRIQNLISHGSHDHTRKL